MSGYILVGWGGVATWPVYPAGDDMGVGGDRYAD